VSPVCARRPRPRGAARAAGCLVDKIATGSDLPFVRAVDLKTLKHKLGEYVRLAASGETVLVTDRDRVVAELTPPRAGRAERLDDAGLAEAVRRGWLTPPTMPGSGPPPRLPIAPTEELLRELDEDRADR
jgi:antitoxin (DNA-binding transcriptional repressor) of toxin-antitoxin stability system